MEGTRRRRAIARSALVSLAAISIVAASAFVGLWRFRWNVLWVVAGSAVAGLIYSSVH